MMKFPALKSEVVYYQNIAEDFSYDARYLRESGQLRAACKRQESAATYARAAREVMGWNDD